MNQTSDEFDGDYSLLSASDHHLVEARQREQAASAIRASSTIAIVCHVNPDGDALGSLLGLGLAIERGFPDKKVYMLAQDGVPEILKFLPESHRIQTTFDILGVELAIVVDSGDLARVGSSLYPAISAAATLLDVDHHVGAGAFGSVRLLDNRAAATAEIVFDLLGELNLEIDRDIATCLFTGVITDTGSFRFMNVTPRTLRVAASLIEAGASPALIAEQVFDNRPYRAVKLLGLTLSTLSNALDGRICWAVVSRDSFEKAQASDQDTEGFVNHIRSARGAEIGILFREAVPGKIRISIRSVETVNAAQIAAQFGGGGHKMAAGATFDGSLEDAVTALVSAASAALNAA